MNKSQHELDIIAAAEARRERRAKRALLHQALSLKGLVNAYAELRNAQQAAWRANGRRTKPFVI